MFLCLQVPGPMLLQSCSSGYVLAASQDLEPVDVLKCTSNGARPDMEAVPPATPKATFMTYPTSSHLTFALGSERREFG